MSDYGGNDYDDDYDDDWLYVEDEYMQADDLAEHAVASPPPIACDEDQIEEWDRFDYFNDLEYGSDGYDDADLVPHSEKSGQAHIGQKRKRTVTATPSKKRQRVTNGARKDPEPDVPWLTNEPIVWRARADRGVKPRPLPEGAKPYAVLEDWRQKFDNTPDWIKRPRRTPRDGCTPVHETASILPKVPTVEEQDDWEDEEEAGMEDEEAEEDGAASIDPDAILAALQSRLASAGGPLSGMDPQQLLQFALRMANGEGEGDDIAGEMADQLLDQGEEDEEDEEAEANLQSWVRQQRQNANPSGGPDIATSGKALASTSPKTRRSNQGPVSSPASKSKHRLNAKDATLADAYMEASDDAEQDGDLEVEKTAHSLEVKQTSRKRKVDTTTDPTGTSPKPKKRATRSFAAPTAASQAKAGPAKTTRSGRAKR